METTASSTLNIYQKLLKIQKEINGLGKDKDTSSQYNPKGYKYVTGDKVLEHIKPLMNNLGLILKQEVISIDNERQDYAIKSGNKSEILSKVMMKFTWVDAESGQMDVNLFGANGQNDWDKGVGSALTYGERYFLLKYFHIATDEDDIDNPERKDQSPAESTTEQQKAEVKPLPEITVKMFNQLITRLKVGENDVITKAKERYSFAKDKGDIVNSIMKAKKADGTWSGALIVIEETEFKSLVKLFRAGGDAVLSNAKKFFSFTPEQDEYIKKVIASINTKQAA